MIFLGRYKGNRFKALVPVFNKHGGYSLDSLANVVLVDLSGRTNSGYLVNKSSPVSKFKKYLCVYNIYSWRYNCMIYGNDFQLTYVSIFCVNKCFKIKDQNNDKPLPVSCV